MKKQILTLTMCLVLTAGSAFAANTPITQNMFPQAPSTFSPTINPSSIMMNQGKTMENPKFMTREEAKQYFKEKMAQERELKYTKLGLSSEQKAKAEALDLKTRAGAKPLVMKFRGETKKLHELKMKHAFWFSIWQQEQALKSAKKDLEKYLKNSRKDFEAILTPEQKIKFEAMEKENKVQMKKFKKGYNHKKPMEIEKTPQLAKPEPMGPPPPDDKDLK